MSSAERRHAVERFDYSRVGGDWAVVRLLARLGLDAASAAGSLPGAAGPVMAAPAARIVVSRDGIDPQSFPARVCMLERRLRGGRREAGSDLLWRAAFALPLELAECAEAQFAVTAAGLAMELPAPGLRIVTARGLELAPPARRQSATRPVIQTRHRLAALATAVVVTAGSTPAAFAADLGTPSNGAPSGAPAGSSATSASATTSTPASTTPAPSTPTPATPAPATTTPSASPAPDGSTTATTSVTSTSSTSTATAPAAPAAPSPAPATPAPATTTVAATPAPAAPATTTAAQPVTTQPAKAPTAQPAVHVATAQASAQSHAKASTHRAATTSKSSTGHKRARLGRVQVVHLFTAKRHAAHGHGGGASLILSNCSSAAGAGAIAYAAAQFTAAETTGRTLHVQCPAASDASAASTSAGHDASAPQGSTLTIHNPGAAAPKSGPTAPTGTTVGTPSTTTGATPAAPRAERPSSSPLAPRARAPRTPASTKQRTGGAPLTTLGSTPATPAPGTTISTLSSTPPGFTGPTAWTGTVAPDPALTGAVTDLSGLLANGDRPPSFLIPIYMQAGHRYGVPWEVLAAINAIESDYGRDLNTSSAGAVGWMQFEPSTWHEWGVAADGHSVPNPYDPRDAIFSAARYLAAAGAGTNVAEAVYAYNHAGWYVSEVLSRASAIAGHAQFERETVNRGTFSVYFATGVRKHPTIRYRSSVLSHFDRLIAAANMVSAANFPYVWGGGHEQPAQFGPFDCSGSVSYVLQQAGYKVPTSTSGNVPVWKFPSGPGRVTIFYNAVHTFMRIGNRYFGTSGFARPGTGGAGWFDVNKLPTGYLAGFNEVHVPHLGVNSFAAPAQASSTATSN
jgi:hypothetical protein